jgi:hypothetical protein
VPSARRTAASEGPSTYSITLYRDPVTWPRRNGRPPRHGIPVTCHNEPSAANPEPDESLLLPGTPRYGTVRIDAWHPVHSVIHGDRGWFKDNWHGELPILRGTLLRVVVDHLPDGRPPHKTMWLWHAGPPRCPPTRHGAPTLPVSRSNLRRNDCQHRSTSAGVAPVRDHHSHTGLGSRSPGR